MKNGMVFLFILLAAVCIVLGIIDKFVLDAKLLVRGYTWHELAQTFLLFGIAWGIWHSQKQEMK